MRDRMIQGWALLIAVFGVLAMSEAQAQIILVEGGKAKCCVVLRPRPKELEGIKGRPRDRKLQQLAQAYSDEKAAADDFVRIVEKMTGARLELVTEAQQGLLPVYIGAAAIDLVPAYERMLKHPDRLTIVNDRFLLSVQVKGVALAGARPWATRLAVTQFFEDVGCRWYGGGKFFEVIPRKRVLRVAAKWKIYTPDFEMRDVWYVQDDDLAHLKLNRHDGVLHHGHSWHNWIGKERKERPELRGLVQGERKGPLEYTHPDVPGIFVRNILSYKERTGSRTVSLSTDDGPVYSQSKESAEWLLKEYANPFMATPAISDALMRLYEQVIPPVLEKYPDTVFGFLVYANTMTPPRYAKVHPALAIVGAPLAENALVPTTTKKDARRIHFRTCLENWMKLAKRGYIYEYDPFVIWHGVLCPRVELIRRNVPYYKSIGIRGMNIESRKAQFAESGLNILVYSRLFWDTSANVDAILNEFAATFYGPAAKPMREWIRVTQKSILRPAAPVFGNEDHNIELIFTPKVMAKAEKALKRAEAQVKTEPWETRVHVVRLIHDHLKAYLESKHAMDLGEFLRSAAAIDRMYKYKKQLHAIDPVLHDTERWDLKSEAPLWLRGLRKLAHRWASLSGELETGAEGRLVQILPQKWQFAFDPKNLGQTNGWAKAKKLPRSKRIDIGQPWDYQGYATPRTANGWYRTRIKVPVVFQGEPVRLLFTRLYGMKITIYLDGKFVEHRDLPRWFWYDYNHQREFDLTKVVTPGRRQTLTVRIFKEFDWGGPYGNVFLYSPKPKKLPPQPPAQ